MVTNAAGVLAGITGIVYSNGTVKSIDVDFKIFDPTGTNVTTFIIQRSYDLKAWADYSSAVTVTGSFPPTEISDLATNKTGQFYRMRLMNFR